MGELKVMKARRALDLADLRDPLGEEAPTAPAPQRQRQPRASSRAAPRAPSAPEPSRPPTSEGKLVTGDLATADLMAGPRSAVAVMFDPDLWIKLAELVAELRAEGVPLSINALLVLTLAEGLPVDDAAVLDVVGRRELALCERGSLSKPEERTVRLPRCLLEPYTTLGKTAAAHGFRGARSAVVNAVVEIAGPQTPAEARALETRARRARSLAVIRREADPPT